MHSATKKTFYWKKKKSHLVGLFTMGDGNAWSVHFACTEDIRRVRIPYPPPILEFIFTKLKQGNKNESIF